MRRLLRDIAEGRALGDVTTLRDPDVMAQARGEDQGGAGGGGGVTPPPPAAAQETFSAVSSIAKFVVPPALSVSEPRKRILTVWPAKADRLNVSCW